MRQLKSDDSWTSLLSIIQSADSWISYFSTEIVRAIYQYQFLQEQYRGTRDQLLDQLLLFIWIQQILIVLLLLNTETTLCHTFSCGVDSDTVV